MTNDNATPSPRVLITGGAGFIGSHITRAWAARGAHVIVLDSLRTGNRDNLRGVPHEFVEGSIEDMQLVRRVMVGVDYVHHLAALVSVPESVAKPQLCDAINVEGTRNVLVAAAAEKVKKVVFSSTCAIYGMVDRPLHREGDPPAPMSPYASSKLAGERLMEEAAAHGVPTVCLRYFNVYGPGQDPNGAYAAAIAAFAARARENMPLTIYGDGEQTRDFVHIDDVVAANLLATGAGSGVYNVSTGERITIGRLATLVIAAAGSTSQVHHAPPREGDVRHSRGDSSRLIQLGWKPDIVLEDGLKTVINKK